MYLSSLWVEFLNIQLYFLAFLVSKFSWYLVRLFIAMQLHEILAYFQAGWINKEILDENSLIAAFARNLLFSLFNFQIFPISSYSYSFGDNSWSLIPVSDWWIILLQKFNTSSEKEIKFIKLHTNFKAKSKWHAPKNKHVLNFRKTEKI